MAVLPGSAKHGVTRFWASLPLGTVSMVRWGFPKCIIARDWEQPEQPLARREFANHEWGKLSRRSRTGERVE